DRQRRFYGVQTDLRIRVTVEIEQHASLIPLTRIQFILDIYHVIEQVIELRCFISKQCLVLLNTNSREPIDQLVQRNVLVSGFHALNVTSWRPGHPGLRPKGYVGLKIPRSRLTSDIPASPACGLSCESAMVRSSRRASSGATANVAFAAARRTCAFESV